MLNRDLKSKLAGWQWFVLNPLSIGQIDSGKPLKLLGRRTFCAAALRMLIDWNPT
jgi:hypothetical protein